LLLALLFLKLLAGSFVLFFFLMAPPRAPTFRGAPAAATYARKSQ
jgi:hypothetical protein